MMAKNFPKLQRLCLTSDPEYDPPEYDEICQTFASERNVKLEIRGGPVLCNFGLWAVKSVCCGHYRIHPSKEMKIFSPR